MAAKKSTLPKSESQWQECLTPEQYKILREKGTEAPFTGALTRNKKDGDYLCAACGSVLFRSGTKFDSGTGWPSFYDVAKSNAVERKEDFSLGVKRVEVECKRCGGHLGHVFDDGPQPTGLRYCINSAALKFKGKKAKA
ncbi:Peptide methionine sulfoxide reductase MsrB [uncultured archaeon]|nr:Peptide methionine sulfoxide reductase MsrB [uncultured archaeon]